MTREQPVDFTRWRRLHPRNVTVGLAFVLGSPAALGLVWLLAGSRLDKGVYIGLASLAGTGVVIGVVVLATWATTWYRLTAERFELRTDLARLYTSQRSIPRDRIRSVDITANPLDRIFGLATVKIGTGQRVRETDEGLKLDGVSHAEAERLRELLLRRAPVSATAGTAAPPSSLIARLDWRWIRYAPLTIWTALGVGVLAGVAYKPLDSLGINPADLKIVKDAVRELRTATLWLVILTAVAIVLVVGVLASLAWFVEAWWGFRLEREPGGTLRVRRGLLTTRSLSLEERRLRGVELVEPMLLRWGGGAHLRAVATGLKPSEKTSGRPGTLTPPEPRAEAHRVAAAVLAEHPDPTAAARLRGHPRAALRRRLTWGLAPVAGVVGVLGGLGAAYPWMPSWAWPVALALAPVAAAYAVDAYRNLGHGLTGGYLVTRSGTFARRTVALRRDGVIGWTVRQSPFQRRAGLATLTATTAAGDGSYHVRDVAVAEGLAFAAAAVPGLLTPFLERSSGEAPRQEAGSWPARR